MPILALMFGVRDAIPILTVAQLIGNGSRVWFNRPQLELPVVAWFALGGVPAAMIGGFLFASAPIALLTRLLGLFLITTAVYRHFGKSSHYDSASWICCVGSRNELPFGIIGQYRTDHDSVFLGLWTRERQSHRH